MDDVIVLNSASSTILDDDIRKANDDVDDIIKLKDNNMGKLGITMHTLSQLESLYNPLMTSYVTRLRDSRPLPWDITRDIISLVDDYLIKYALILVKNESITKSTYKEPKKF